MKANSDQLKKISKQQTVSVPKYNNAKGEAVTDRILGHLILSAVFVLAGLAASDRLGARGFPFGWYQGPDQIRPDGLIGSFLVFLAVTVSADIIASLIGRAAEPSMKDSPRQEVVSSDERASFSYDVKVSEAETLRKRSAPERKSASTAVRMPGSTKAAPEKSPKDKNMAVMIIIAAMVLSVFSVISTLSDDSYNDDSGYYSDEEDIYSDDGEKYISDLAEDAVSSIMLSDYEWMSELGDPAPFEALGDLSGFEQEPAGSSFEYDYSHAVYKYFLFEDIDDEDADIYLAAILLEGDDLEGSPEDAAVSGISVYKFKSREEYEDYTEGGFYDGDGTVEERIDPDDCISIGKTEAKGNHILSSYYYCYY